MPKPQTYMKYIASNIAETCKLLSTVWELLAVSYALDNFLAYLEGHPIIVRTDHQPLIGTLTQKANTALGTPRRHLLNIAYFLNQLHYMTGVADALSRVKEAVPSRAAPGGWTVESGFPKAVPWRVAPRSLYRRELNRRLWRREQRLARRTFESWSPAGVLSKVAPGSCIFEAAPRRLDRRAQGRVSGAWIAGSTPGWGYSLYWGIHVCAAQMPLVLAIFFSLSEEIMQVFSLCAPIKPDNSLFHRKGNFPMKTFRPGLPYTYRYLINCSIILSWWP